MLARCDCSAEMENPVQLERMDSGSLSQRAYGILREGLIAGRFRPGQRFLMKELAEQLGTSITPVREACMRLVSERGLELHSGRFVLVPALSLSRYLEVRTIRLALEGLAVELAAGKANPGDITRLEKLHAKFAAAVAGGKSEASIQTNREFHFAVYGLAGMDMLAAHIEELWMAMGPILNVFYNDVRSGYAGEEHLAVIEALRRNDGARARTSMREDIMKGGESIAAYLKEHELAASA